MNSYVNIESAFLFLRVPGEPLLALVAKIPIPGFFAYPVM
jgi:hypothetical protein